MNQGVRYKSIEFIMNFTVTWGGGRDYFGFETEMRKPAVHQENRL